MTNLCLDIMFSDNFSKGRYYGFFVRFYNRTKIFLMVAAVIFFFSLIIGVFAGYFLPNTAGSFLGYVLKGLGSHVEKTAVSIFINNFKAALLVYAGGVTGVITAGSLSFNGFIYGSFLGYFGHGGVLSHYGVSTPQDFIIYTLPHGIFEIPALIIAGASGLMITSTVIGAVKSILKKTPVNEHYWKLKDSLVLFIIAVALFIIAAIIEANITPALGNYITGLNIH